MKYIAKAASNLYSLLRRPATWIMVVGGFGGKFVLVYVKDGVTIDEKIEGGQFLFLYRENPEEWVPVSAWLYNVVSFHQVFFLIMFCLVIFFELNDFMHERRKNNV